MPGVRRRSNAPLKCFGGAYERARRLAQRGSVALWKAPTGVQAEVQALGGEGPGEPRPAPGPWRVVRGDDDDGAADAEGRLLSRGFVWVGGRDEPEEHNARHGERFFEGKKLHWYSGIKNTINA